MPKVTGIHFYPVKSMYRLSPEAAAVEPWGLAGDRRWMLVDERGRAVTQREERTLGQYRPVPLADGSLEITAPDGARIEVPAPTAELGDPQLKVDVFDTWLTASEAAPEVQAWFADRLPGCRLVHLDRPDVSRPVDPKYGRPGETVSLADGYPLLIATTASLADLNARITAEHPDDPRKGTAVPMERFRPNLVVDGTEPWAEDGWRRIRVGDVVFRVAKPCGRCVVTTTDQETGDRRGPQPLLALGRHRRFGQKLVFGQNLVPERPERAQGVGQGPEGPYGKVRLGDELTVLEAGPHPLPDHRD